MSDIPQMPNNAESYYRKALNELSHNNFTKAIHFLEESYQIDNNLEAFEELIKTFIMTNNELKLKQLWDESKFSFNNITTSNKLSMLYAQSLPSISLSEDSLLKLYQLKDKNPSHIVHKEVNKAIATVDEALIIFKQLDQNKSAHEIDKLVHRLLNYEPFIILEKLKVIYKLPFNLSEPLLLSLLQKDSLLNYIKSDIMHFFLYSHYNKEAEISWFGKKYHVSFDDLKPYNEIPLYQIGIQYINDYMSKENPHLIYELVQLFTLHTMVLYPFVEKTMPAAEQWLKIVNQLPEIILDSDSTEFKHTLKYIELANDELNNLFQN